MQWELTSLLTNEIRKNLNKLEQILKGKDPRGNQVSINKNCAEMDKQIPILMGVSNSILDYVIFWHQEDSLWPFSDQGNLKKIFDEIFQTAKYTKALEEMRKMKKKFNSYAKEYQKELELIKKDFEQYTHLKENFNKTKQEIESNELTIESYKIKIKELEKDLEEHAKIEMKLK